MSKSMDEQFTCRQLMLPEHREALKKRIERLREEELPDPAPDGQKQELFERLLRQSLRHGSKLVITIVEKKRGLRKIRGTAGKIIPGTGKIVIITAEGTETITPDDITEIEEDYC